MISLKNVSFSYGKRKVLDDISCTINAGEVVVVVGANGAGKTTFFDVIAGKCTPSHGSLFIDGEDITHTAEKQRAPIIGRLLQNPTLNCASQMTVIENVALSLYKGKKIGLHAGIDDAVQKRMHELASILQYDPQELAHKKMGSLSGGQRQTIAFIMTTFVKPKLLLLDEPTAALDPQAATRMLCFAMAYIKRHKLTAIPITHDPQLALSIGETIWVLDEGKITKKITAEEKNTISAKDLVGHIDYEKIMKSDCNAG